MGRLEDKVAIITGGASGIGKATAQEFINEGSKVVIADIDEENGKALEKELSSSADVLFVKTDVTDENKVENLISKAVEKYGKLDVLFNNAGIVKNVLAHDMDYEDWRKQININLDGEFLTFRHAIQQMLKNNDGGPIVNTASIMGHVSTQKQSAYTASKNAIVGLTKTLSLEYAKDNIRVNAVCPGFVDTGLLDFLSEEERKETAALHPMNRMAKPEEVAKAAAFLASDNASFVTGSSLMVDGGLVYSAK